MSLVSLRDDEKRELSLRPVSQKQALAAMLCQQGESDEQSTSLLGGNILRTL